MTTPQSSFLKTVPYQPASWTKPLKLVPSKKVSLGILPTPLHPVKIPQLSEYDVQIYFKRDDLSGMQLSGNKVRKLEFLMHEALEGGYDSVITLGGIQSNHCRATAVAAKYAGLKCHLILRCTTEEQLTNPGLNGNLLLDFLTGAQIHTITRSQYGQYGQDKLSSILKDKLQEAGERAYVIPVGGSNSLGTWGYMDCMTEIAQQCKAQDIPVTDVVCASGSGATSGGLALANHMGKYGTRVSTYGVCDSPQYFYDYINGLFEGLGAGEEVVGAKCEQMLTCRDAKGLGYAVSQAEELAVMKDVCESTGILLDPVYSGKAMYGFINDVKANPDEWKGKHVVFVHTGGLLGMYDKMEQLSPLVSKEQVSKLL